MYRAMSRAADVRSGALEGPIEASGALGGLDLFDSRGFLWSPSLD